MKLKNLILFGIVFIFMINLVLGTQYNYLRDSSDTNKVWILANYTGNKNFYILNVNGIANDTTKVLPSVKHFYPFENVSKDFVGALDGTINGNTLLDGNNCKFSKCYNWDGSNDYMTLGDTTELNSATAFTIEGWFYYSNLTKDQWMLRKYSDNNNYIGLELAANSLYFLIYTGASGTYGNLGTISGLVSLNTWNHWVFYYNGSSGGGNSGRMKVYVNNVERGFAYTGTIPATTANLATKNLYIGQNALNDKYWVGRADELKIYGKALSTTEIAQLYNSYKYKNLSTTRNTFYSWYNFSVVSNATAKTNYMTLFSGVDLSGDLNITDTVPVVNFSISAKNNSDNISINQFNVRLQNGTTIVNHIVTSGYVLPILKTDKRKYNITFYNMTDFYNRTYLNYNFSTSGDLVGLLNRSYFYVDVYDNYTGTRLNKFNLTTGTTTYNNYNRTQKIYLVNNSNVNTIKIHNLNYINKTITGLSTSSNLTTSISSTNITFEIRFFNSTELEDISLLNITDLNYSISFNTSTGILNFNPTYGNTRVFKINSNITYETNYTVNLTGNSNQTYTIYVTDIKNKIRFLDATNSSALANATISIIYPSGENIIRTTNSTGWINFSYINSSNLIDFGNYQLTFNKYTFLETNINITILNLNIPYSNTFNISRTNINFTFKDSETHNLITNVSAEIISSSYSDNFSTEAKSYLYIDLLYPESYSVKYEKSGYGTNFYYFTGSSSTSENITLYLINSSLSTTVNAFVYDQTNKLTEGVLIKCLKYDITTNSYILNQMRYTNLVGQTQFDLILGTELYKFILEYPTGTIVKETEAGLIYSTTLNFIINIGTTVADYFFNTLDINYYLSFDNTTNNFTFTYTDSASQVSQGCLKIYEYSTGTEILTNNSCVSSTTATITLSVTNTSGLKYIARAYVYFGSNPYLLDSYIYEFTNPPDFVNEGLFFTAVLIIILVSLFYSSISIALIVAGLPIILMSLLGVINLAVGYAIGIELLLICLAAWVSQWQR